MFKFNLLIKKAKKRIPSSAINRLKVIGFGDGADWMASQMGEKELASSQKSLLFNTGFIKYFLSLLGAAISLYLIGLKVIYAYLLAVIIFYVIEVHFLFIFPITIDQKENPFLKSVLATYKVGLISCILNVIPIAAFMLLGLLNYKRPLYNWYLGCMCIIIWYEEEVRDWI